MKLIHESYHPQNSCLDCKFCFRLEEYDDPPRYFCMFSPPERPICTSVLMGEAKHLDINDKKWINAMEKFDEWCVDREVSPRGICDHWWKRKD